MSEAASPGHSLNDGQTRRRVAQEEGAHRSLLYPSRIHETDPSSPGQGHPVVVRVGAASTLRAAIHRKMTRVLIKVRAQNNRSRAITLQHPSAQNGTYGAVRTAQYCLAEPHRLPVMCGCLGRADWVGCGPEPRGGTTVIPPLPTVTSSLGSFLSSDFSPRFQSLMQPVCPQTQSGFSGRIQVKSPPPRSGSLGRNRRRFD